MRLLLALPLTLLLLAANSAADHGESWSWGKSDEKITEEQPSQKRIDSEPTVQTEARSYQDQEQANSNQGNNGTIEDVVETILVSNRQGRNIDGLDEVYEDASIKSALQNGDDAQARNLIREKLCSLGLMQCDEFGEEKRPYLSPEDLIYAQPVDIRPVGRPIASIPVRGGKGGYNGPQYNGPQYNGPPKYNGPQQLNNGPPRNGPPPPPGSGPYGPPKPMPLPNNNFGPPRKVGYAPSNKPPGPIYSGGPSYPPTAFGGPPKFTGSSFSGSSSSQFSSGSSQSSFPLGSSQSSFPPTGPFQKPSLGPVYEANANPYEFEKGVINTELNGGSLLTKEPAQQHIHHHYHHVDEGTQGPKTVVVNNPVPVSIPVPIPSANSVSNSYSSNEFQSSNGFSSSNYKGVNSGGFGPVNGLNSNSAGSYATNSKPVYESSNFGGSSGFGSSGLSGSQYTSGLNNFGAGQLPLETNNFGSNSLGYNGNSDSFHASNPNYYKKELNLNGGSNNGLSSYQNNKGEQYQSFESARQENYDCVCVPFDQCPDQDRIAKKNDLFLPLDPRNLPTEIEANDETSHANGTVPVIRVTKNANATEEEHAANEDHTVKKVAKRDVNSKQASTEIEVEKANIEPVII
jgi:hypothetical protein